MEGATMSQRMGVLWIVACLLVACVPRTAVPSPTPSAEVGHVESHGTATVTLEPTGTLPRELAVTPLASPMPPTSTPEPPPPGMAYFRGTSTYDWARRFVLLYPLDTWLRDGGWLRHQAIPGCTLYPQAGGMGLGPDWRLTADRVTLGDWDFERRSFTQEGQTVPALVTYGLGLDESYFLIQVSAGDLDQATFSRCRADAEAVLATFAPLEPVSGDFAAARATLDVYEPPHAPVHAVTVLALDIAEWLSRGNDPAGLAAILHTLPKLDAVQPEVTLADLNGDGRSDVVVQTHLMGLPVVACLAQEDDRFVGQGLPFVFEEPLPTSDSTVSVHELTGDNLPETVVTYAVQGGSGWTELLYVFRCVDASGCAPIFQASLVNWAGPSAWALEADQARPDRWQIVLTYPRLYGDGFDHKMLNHPQGRQVWRWDAGAGRFALAEETVDLEQSNWGAEPPVTFEDRLRWLTNEGEAAFRSGEYGPALLRMDQVLGLAASEGWTPEDGQPDWAGYARFRRAETLALEGRTGEALADMRAVVVDYAGDPLGALAVAFLDGYGDGGNPDAPARGVATMQAVDLYSHFYYERGGALAFPMDVGGILYPGAGLAAYLEARPDLEGDSEGLLAGLREVGFAAERVVVDGEVLVELWLPNAPDAGRVLVPWTLARSDGRWRVVSPGVEEIPDG